MPYETLLIEIKDQVALVRLNRPQALNALNSQLMQELADALSAMDHDPEVRCIVLTGSEKAFAAGADIKEMAQKSFAEMFTEALFAEEFDAIGRLR
ncbi:MAG: enoyl-CoA hydratase-related protein, partial [Cypionkella sp.]